MILNKAPPSFILRFDEKRHIVPKGMLKKFLYYLIGISPH